MSDRPSMQGSRIDRPGSIARCCSHPDLLGSADGPGARTCGCRRCFGPQCDWRVRWSVRTAQGLVRSNGRLIDLRLFLPPIGGTSVYLFGEPTLLGRSDTPVTCRMHDECNGSDVFGSDLCTCRPYLMREIEECVKGAQAGGVGIVVYNRKEGRALGEVVKYLVYNARMRDPLGDGPERYFDHTFAVAGTADLRMQDLSTDVLNWLGVRHIATWVSMEQSQKRSVASGGDQYRTTGRDQFGEGVAPRKGRDRRKN